MTELEKLQAAKDKAREVWREVCDRRDEAYGKAREEARVAWVAYDKAWVAYDKAKEKEEKKIK